jgi:uncharacterized protein (DUF433 family)
MTEKSFTPAEASAIVKLPLKAVHKAIDGRVIRTHKVRHGNQVQRLLSFEQLVYLRLEAEGLRILPMKSRREVARATESDVGIDVIAVAGSSVLFIQAKDARDDVERELKRLRRVEEMVVCDPEIMGGAPVFRGTRIPVDLVAAMRSQGASVEEILEGYPALNPEQVELASLYVSAFPRRGRPVRRPWAAEKPVRVARFRRSVKA